METEKETEKVKKVRNTKIRNNAIILGVLLVLIAAVTVPLWNKPNRLGPNGAQEPSGTTPFDGISPGGISSDGQGGKGASGAEGGGNGYSAIGESGENSIEYSKNTIRDSRTGEVVFVPQSDPEQSDSLNAGKVETIRESRTGEEVPVPKSDPESGK